MWFSAINLNCKIYIFQIQSEVVHSEQVRKQFSYRKVTQLMILFKEIDRLFKYSLYTSEHILTIQNSVCWTTYANIALHFHTIQAQSIYLNIYSRTVRNLLYSFSSILKVYFNCRTFNGEIIVFSCESFKWRSMNE